MDCIYYTGNIDDLINYIKSKTEWIYKGAKQFPGISIDYYSFTNELFDSEVLFYLFDKDKHVYTSQALHISLKDITPEKNNDIMHSLYKNLEALCPRAFKYYEGE